MPNNAWFTHGWNAWSLYWILWLVIGFGVPEAIALITGHSENTLSDQVWRLEGYGATFFRFFAASFFLWLLLHMVFRLFRS